MGIFSNPPVVDIEQTLTDSAAKVPSSAAVVKSIGGISVVDNGNSGASKTINWTTGGIQKITTTGSCTVSFTAPLNPCTLVLKIIHEASATSYTYVWPGTVKWQSGTAPTTTNTSGAVDVISFFYDGTNYYGAFGLDYQ